MTLHYNKLIRDNVPEHFAKRGKKISYHQAKSDDEYWHKLKEKLQEELNEFARKEDMDTLVDVLEVIDAIALFKRFDRKEMNAIKENKAIEFGRFMKRHVLDQSHEEFGHPQEQIT